MALLIGIAKLKPAPGPDLIKVLIPITSPLLFRSGPPEFPGLIAASVWINSSFLSYIPNWVTFLFRLLMIPSVTVFSSPNGFPTAIAQSPTLIFVESPNCAFGQGPLPSILSTAKSVKKSCPISFAFNFLPLVKPTITLSDPFTTWALVITNAHVVNGSDKVIVGLTNGKKLKAKLIGQDFFTDLAVLKIEGKGPWPKAQLGDSTKIKVGDWAIAVGNPFGLENTVTLGIISNLKRNVTQLGIYDKKLELIQTDAAINPGNSGGPLLNSNGEVIGINTLIRSGPGAGLSFAIPINKAKEIAYQLINNGKVIHPMIGISLIDESNFETNNNAVKVGYVVPNSPAEKIGIKINDIIIKVGNKDIKSASDVISEVSKNGIDKQLNIVLRRRNKIINFKVIPTDITNIQNN